MFDEKLKAIAARLQLITPGPWTTMRQNRKRGDYTVYVYRDYLGAQDVVAGCIGDDATPADKDAEFIAHAPDDIRALLAEVERLRTENARLQALAHDMPVILPQQWTQGE